MIKSKDNQSIEEQ